MAQAQAACVTAEKSGDAMVLLRLLGKRGEWHYLLGDNEEALALLPRAIDLAQRLGRTDACAANRLRRATAFQYANRHPEAVDLFVDGLAMLTPPIAATYRDFFLQHYGKCLVEMGRLTEARTCFTEALTLRQTKGDVTLIASTTRALDALAQRDNPARGR